MRIKQTIARAGAHLVVTLTEQPSGKRLAQRVWENCAQYIQGERDGFVHVKIPVSCELDIKPGRQS
jgi:hypothetical protein